ncbi:MAG: dihydroorotase [Bacillota bacterium]
MKTLIKGARVLDPAGKLNDITDILIIDKKIAAIGTNLGEADKVVEAQGKLAVPGLIDVHVHLRDPGQTYKEDLTSGTKAAAQGGFTTIACMPNTIPVIDSPEKVSSLLERIKEEAWVNVLPMGAITLESEGRALTDFRALKEAGVIAFSDDGKVVQNAELMHRALIRSKELGLPISQHAEDVYLSSATVINEGEIAFRLGVKGDPDVSESIIVARDILLAAHTGGHIHIEHISSGATVDLIREAKAKGIKVTAEVTPHHLLLTDEDVLKKGVNCKMRPPLRSDKDLEALRAGLADGTIDCIATDHAPHAVEEKDVGLPNAANGIVGLETAVGLILTHLVHPGIISLETAIAAWTHKPAQIFDLQTKGRIAEGFDADITIIDMEKDWTVDTSLFYSKGKNTPFEGWKLKGKVILTMVAGKVVWTDENTNLEGVLNGTDT